jgi:GPH family glycoside/pentoside/hexuronide:cation symporter
VSPGAAGTISSVALFISAVMTFFVGYFSDNSRAKSGRRRSFIKATLPLIFISFVAVFSSFDLTGTAGIIYYGFFTILIWVSYCVFFVPYTALGAEISSDYTVRTSIRAYAAVGTQVGNFIASALPLTVVAGFMALGQSEKMSWSIMATIFGGISVLVIGIMVYATKGRELIIEHRDGEKRPNLFKDYFEVMRAKPTKYLLLAIISFIIANSIFASNITFFVIYKLEMAEAYVSTIFALVFMVAVPLAAVINLVAQKLDKRKAFILLFCISAIALIIFKFIGINNIIMLGAAAMAFVIANATYWQLISATLYDVAEVIELKTDRRLEGILSSLQSITQQIGASVAMFILGWVLDLNGFVDAAPVQIPKAINAISTLQTLIPGIGLLITAALLVLFPISKQKYELVQKALSDKKSSGKFNRTGLERII